MATKQIIVKPKQEGWRIKSNTSWRTIRHCKTRQEAITAAIKICKDTDAELVVLDAEGKVVPKPSKNNARYRKMMEEKRY